MTDEKQKRAASRETVVSRHARQAIAEAASRCPAWNNSLARMAAHVRRVGPKPSLDFANECAEILIGVREARQQLVLNLMDAPRVVLSNSRITDIERVLDRIEASVRDIQAVTTRSTSMSVSGNGALQITSRQDSPRPSAPRHSIGQEM